MRTSQIAERTDYYPFGLTFNSYQRENSVDQRYKFNGMEAVQDIGINWLHPNRFRTYDPSIARFNGIDPLADKSVNVTPYVFVMNNPLLYTDLMGADTTKATLLQAVVVSATRIARDYYNWFTGVSVGYTGSGWGHGPRRWVANRIGLGNTANNLIELGIHSQLQSKQVSLSGRLLDKIKKDPAMVKFRNDIVKALKADPRFKNMAFAAKGRGGVEFGGKRWSSANEDWSALDNSNPLAHEETWAVAANELTWATRHASIDYTATVKSDGTIVIDFHLSDTLDLSPQQNRSQAYNTISSATGLLYHDVVGGNSDIKVNADWQIIK